MAKFRITRSDGWFLVELGLRWNQGLRTGTPRNCYATSESKQETRAKHQPPPGAAAQPGDFADSGRAHRDHGAKSESHSATCRKDGYAGQAWQCAGSPARRLLPDDARGRGQAVRHRSPPVWG